MPQKNKTLHLFTAKFPFGNKSETFLDTEVTYLSKAFDKVIIYPSSKKSTQRDLPSNFTVNDLFCSINLTKKQKLKLIFKTLATALSLLLSHSKNVGVKATFKHRKTLLEIISQQLFKLESFNKNVGFNQEDLYYDYWFENSTLMLSMAHKKGLIKTAISRGHGFDIYDERWTGIGVPFRKFKLENLKKVFIISDFGKNSMVEKSPKELTHKIQLSRLGVQKFGRSETLRKSESSVIVSCSSILDFKQVEKIPSLLKGLSTPVKWIHFGDGPNKHVVESEIESLPSTITVELKGHVDNSELVHFYQTNQVDLFITLSTSEGLPVSMMEAQSFGIPIVAHPVGGIPEIVKDEITGFLIEQDWTLEKKTEFLEKALHYNFNTSTIEGFFLQNFDAEKNYTDFTEQLCSLEN
tara:strand:+ start:1066 stop:2292 length:1227 start_codon:yes stop_codon:yes gene_type:complete